MGVGSLEPGSGGEGTAHQMLRVGMLLIRPTIRWGAKEAGSVAVEPVGAAKLKVDPAQIGPVCGKLDQLSESGRGELAWEAVFDDHPTTPDRGPRGSTLGHRYDLDQGQWATIDLSMGRAYAIILAGGEGRRLVRPGDGERFGPLAVLPKIGSLLEATIEQLQPLIAREDLYLVVGTAQRPLVRRRLPHLPAQQMISEPLARGTLIALVRAMAVIERRDDDIALVVPANAYLEDPSSWRRSVSAALDRAALGDHRLGPAVVLGVEPDESRADLSYLTYQKEDLVASLVSSSSRSETTRLISRGARWSSGVFAIRHDRLRSALWEIAPELVAALGGRADLATAYAALARVDYDRRLLGGLATIGALRWRGLDAGWSTIGSAAALQELLERLAR